jgi:hypothetical protein
LHLVKLLRPWAGILRPKGHEPVYWLSPGDVVYVFPWRGISPFGYDRDWSEIAYPEAIGLAREAVERRSSDPVDYICRTFDLKRRHPKTLASFQLWVDAEQMMSSSDRMKGVSAELMENDPVIAAVELVLDEARKLGVLSSNSRLALDAIARRQEKRLDSTSRNALNYLLDRLPLQGEIAAAVKVLSQAIE